MVLFVELMLKRASFIVAIAAVLVAGFVPASDACAVGVARDHACCAESRSEHAPACCSGADITTVDTVGHDLHCSCAHRPATLASATAAGPSFFPDDHGSPIDGTAFLAALTPRSARHITDERRLRAHPPPPVFLLDCAFLI